MRPELVLSPEGLIRKEIAHNEAQITALVRRNTALADKLRRIAREQC